MRNNYYIRFQINVYEVTVNYLLTSAQQNIVLQGPIIIFTQ